LVLIIILAGPEFNKSISLMSWQLRILTSWCHIHVIEFRLANRHHLMTITK